MRLRDFPRPWRGTSAAADNITHGSWIITAVGAAAMTVGLIAVPGSPVHHWLSCNTAQVAAISSTKTAANTCAADAGGSTVSSPTILDPANHLVAEGAWTGSGGFGGVAAYQGGTAWSTLPVPSGYSAANLLAWNAGTGRVAANFVDMSAGTESGLMAWTGTQWAALGGSGELDAAFNLQTGSLAALFLSQSSSGAETYSVATQNPTSGAWSVRATSTSLWNGLAWDPVNGDLVVAGTHALHFWDSATDTWSTANYSASTQGSVGAPVINPATGAVAVVWSDLNSTTGNTTYAVASWQGGAWAVLGNPFGSTVDPGTMAYGPNGQLVVGAYGAGIAAWNGSAWTAMPNPNGSTNITALAGTPQQLAVATFGSGVYTWTGSGWTAAGNPGGNPDVAAVAN